MMAAAIALFACSMNLSAQDMKKKRMSREQLAEVQAKHIARELAFDDQTTKKFVETFCDCQKEVWALDPAVKNKDFDEMTEAETEKAIKAQFERSRKMLNIRESYYAKYSKFLTQKQIQRVYKLEKKAISRLAKHKHGKMGPKKGMHRAPGKGPGKGPRKGMQHQQPKE